jgi:hypothetical protein
MKTDLHKQTKYFWKEYNQEKRKFELIEIHFNRENWFFVQVDASIRTAFYKYNFPIPPYVIVEKLEHYITFYIVRDKIKNQKELLEWSEKWLFIKSDLDIQAKCNSSDMEDDEYWVHYEFKLI